VDYGDRFSVTVRVVDDIGRTAEATTLAEALEGVLEDDEVETMPAPRNVVAECSGDEIAIGWNETWPQQAKYILLRLNDVDLDYVPVTELSTTINGIANTAELASLKVAWLDEDLELGDWADVELTCAMPVNLEPVETGRNVASAVVFWGGLVAVVAMAMAGVYKKYLPH